MLEPNHVIVNKYSPINQTDLGDGGYSPNKQEYKHTKMSYKGTAPSTVDKVMITSNENENFIIKVSTLSLVCVVTDTQPDLCPCFLPLLLAMDPNPVRVLVSLGLIHILLIALY